MPSTPPGIRRPRTQRPAPDWDLVYRRNSLERLKRDRPPDRVRGELPDLIARGYEDIPEEDLVRLHWWGLAHDKPKIGSFMVRIKVAGGLLTPAQLRGLGAIARTRGQDQVELTTRQGVQLHWVPLARLPDVVEEVEAIGLTTAGAEGDTIRNLTSCPLAGISRHELFDVRPVVREVAAFFDRNPAYSNLPRKHKYTVSACPAQCNAPEISDVALVGTLRDGRRGFGLRVGGGMANTPRISRDLGVFVPVEDSVPVLRAVTDAWQSDLRYRTSRARARIKFMVDDLGAEGMRSRVEQQLGRPLEDGASPAPAGESDHMAAAAQRQRGLVHLGLPVPSGRVSGTVLEALADLVEEVGGDIRLTRQQNLVVGNVPAGRVPDLREALTAAGLSPDRGRAFARSVACTSNRFCNYSVAATKSKLTELLDHLTVRYGTEAIGDLGIHLDGCPHACAQHWIGEIGLQGTTTHLEGSAERSEAYDLSVGGGLGPRTAIGRRLLRRVPTHEIAEVLERLVGAWLEARADRPEPGAYAFGNFCGARTDEELVALASGRRTPPESAQEQCGVRVLVPGPLQRYVDGADELTVDAGTVGDVLTEVSRRHPELGRLLFPDQQVAGAFLVTVGDDDIRTLRGLATPVTHGDAVSIVSAMAGG
ncbi:MAG: MoaD/ThiS family protein [Actinomycetes bacterium]